MRKFHLSRLLAAALSLLLLVSLLPAGAAAAADPAKIDVWDFGAEQLDEATYNNMLSVEEINSWYPEGTAAGTNGNTLPSFQSATGLSFNDGGKPNTHRIRTVNEALTRKDEKSLMAEDGTVYNGYIYSNSGKNPDVYVALELNAGDKVTVIAGSNGKESLITFEGPSGVEDQQNFTNLGGAQTMVFYPCENGTYKFWSATEKLVIARIYRERAQHVTVSGTVTAPAGLTDYSVAFTNTTNGAVTGAKVGAEGTYSAVLPAPFTYDVSLLDANGYVVDAACSTLALTGDEGSKSFDVTVNAVPLVTVKGKITGLSEKALGELSLTFAADTVYVPQVTVEGDSYTAVLAQGDTYIVTVSGVNDYDLTSAKEVSYTADAEADVVFAAKPTHKVTIDVQGLSRNDLSKAAFTFTNLNEAGEAGDTRLVPYSTENVYPYTYTFTGADGIRLRDGVYDVKVTGVEGYTQKLTSNVVVDGADVTKTIGFEAVTTPAALPYKETVTVGPNKDYQTINDALSAVRRMERTDTQRVTIAIDPGDYEEMLVVDVPNVTLKNASENPSLDVTGKGVTIDPEAVRITWYYGCGYNYYSMGEDCKYHADLLKVNKENGYESFVNPGDGVVNGSYWNSTVVVEASGFESYGIIYENSFNQYVSPKSVEDVIVPNSKCKEDKAAPRAEMKTVGDTTVQGYSYKERAGALSMGDNCTEMYFENCRFISRQDTLYGGDNTVAAFYNCQIQGSTDYIYGPMTAVFAKCDLIFNTGETSEFDSGYVTAPRHTATRGFLMYNCNVRSTVPGVDTASELVSKPGYLGRPWEAKTGESVFYKTVINPSYGGQSMILPEGWLDSLSGRSALCGEYATVEATPGVDNTAKRASWAAQFAEAKLADGTAMEPTAWLGGWDAFAGKDMTVLAHTRSEGAAAKRTVQAGDKAVELDVLTINGVDYVWIRDAATALAGTAGQFNVTWNDGVDLIPGAQYVPSGPENTAALANDAVYAVPPFSTKVNSVPSGIGALVFTDANGGGYTYYALADLAAALGCTVK